MVRAPSALTSGSTPLKRRARSFDASCLARASCSVLSSEMPSSVARRSAGQVVEEFWIATLTSGGSRETPAVNVEATRPTGGSVDLSSDESDSLRQARERLPEGFRRCWVHRGRAHVCHYRHSFTAHDVLSDPDHSPPVTGSKGRYS